MAEYRKRVDSKELNKDQDSKDFHAFLEEFGSKLHNVNHSSHTTQERI
jgi:hypothetical protein